jgi:ATP-dependent DNA helicase RecQ
VAYHAGLKAAQRREVHDAFLTSPQVVVVVATSAFALGIVVCSRVPFSRT